MFAGPFFCLAHEGIIDANVDKAAAHGEVGVFDGRHERNFTTICGGKFVAYNVRMTRFDEMYQEMLKRIMSGGVREKNQRTGHETIALPGMHFSIDIEKEGFPLLTLRKIPVKMFVAEQIWFISGARKPADFLRDFTKIWDSFTNPADVVTVAYGYRWRKHFGRDQLGLLVNLLK